MLEPGQWQIFRKYGDPKTEDLQEIWRSKGLGREQVTGHSYMAGGAQKLIRKVSNR